ncbi:MAG: Trk family potassium uptake protein [Elusimicrobiota bacterium]|jgi:trk system potassium uptake protein TrkH|nr:Trk family potassium uptake protein [Elusimicrobiota bacterium]
MNYSPAKTLILFFLSLICIGTILLSIPISLNKSQEFSILANLFTAVSAVCVTGLSVVSIGSYYTLFGQSVIIVLMEAGALGYMFVSTVAALLLGRMALKDRRIMQELFDITSFKDLKKLLIKAIFFVLAVEGVGVFILTLLYMRHFSFFKALYFGIFSAVSAFCNSGFFPFEDSLTSFDIYPSILAVFTVLIIVGGLGFFVMVDIYDTYKEKRLHLSLHTKVVFSATIVILFVSFLFFFVFADWSFLGGSNLMQTISNSIFMSASARTAGFNTIDMGTVSPFLKFFIIIVMAIGAAPASAAGGLKITTLVIVIAFIRSFVKSEDEVVLFKKRIPDDIVKKASVIFILFVLLLAMFAAVLILFEPDKKPIDLLFETVSAFATCGLSVNLTNTISPQGQVTLIFAMITGRIGILTLLLSIVNTKKRNTIRYPEDKILVG